MVVLGFCLVVLLGDGSAKLLYQGSRFLGNDKGLLVLWRGVVIVAVFSESFRCHLFWRFRCLAHVPFYTRTNKNAQVFNWVFKRFWKLD